MTSPHMHHASHLNTETLTYCREMVVAPEASECQPSPSQDPTVPPSHPAIKGLTSDLIGGFKAMLKSQVTIFPHWFLGQLRISPSLTSGITQSRTTSVLSIHH